MVYALSQFVFYYPLAMSILWVVGALYFFFRREYKANRTPPAFGPDAPMVSILIPAHNENAAIEETVRSMAASDYPNFEVIIVDDGSTDDTPQILEKLAKELDSVRSFYLHQNMGKPSALRYGLTACRGSIIVTIDADAYLDPQALRWIVKHFEGPRVGAVTGNPRVRNRTSLLAKIQVGEYSSIIGMIKRTQRILGKILTVSGVIAAFRREALYDIGLWDIDMITDDINVTWKMEKRFWDIRYEPNALCWILVPESIRGLWKQRLRWAQGGSEVVRRHFSIWEDWRQRRLWPVYLEYVTSVFWSYAFTAFLVVWLLSFFFPFAQDLPFSMLPNWKGAVLILICLLQFAAALYIDRTYEPNIFSCIFWVIWYPFFYWMLTAFATVVATPKALTRKFGTLATWTSPDRGLAEKK